MRLANLIVMCISATRSPSGKREYQKWFRDLKLSFSENEEVNKSFFERLKEGKVKTVFERLKEFKNGF